MRKKAIESLLCTGSTSSIHTHTLDPLSVRPRPKAATSAAAFTNTAAGGGAFVSQIKFMAISPLLLSSVRVQNRKMLGLSWIHKPLTRFALHSKFIVRLNVVAWNSKSMSRNHFTIFFNCYRFSPL